MSTYAIGDVQGCYEELLRLFHRIGFAAERDAVWFTGDLVNRGPQSLEVLRFVRDLGDRAITVLGNHDLHLLAVASLAEVETREKDTLADILGAPDCTELLDWLRTRPLLHSDAASGYHLLHAGLAPQWDITEAKVYASEVEACLRGPDSIEFLRHMYGDEPARWSPSLRGWERLRCITNCFTRMRYCDRDGRLNFKAKGTPGTQPTGLRPWYEIENRRSQGSKLIFGHWSTLRLGLRAMQRHNVFALDTGCLWGGQLTAMRLEDQRLFHQPSLQRIAVSETAN
jgi:bis(5'-nucleosyl)-tetraphosphatase (symmetrical)